MPGDVELPEEAVERLAELYYGRQVVDENYPGDEEQEASAGMHRARRQAAEDLEEVAPSLRAQGAEEEKQRIRRACSELKIYRPLIDGDPFPVVLVEALENALDDLEGER